MTTRIKQCQGCGFDLAALEEEKGLVRFCVNCGVRWFKAGNNFTVRQVPTGDFSDEWRSWHLSFMGKPILLHDISGDWGTTFATDNDGLYFSLQFHRDWLENLTRKCLCPTTSCVCGVFAAEQRAKGLVYSKWTVPKWTVPKRNIK